MQLALTLATAVAATIVAVAVPRVARADDHAEASTQVFEERRSGGLGGLTVVHPQVDVGADAGSHVNIDAGYSADAVTGATASVYQVDAVSSATKFSDTRQQGTLAVGFQGRRSKLTLSGLFGTERDYLSRQIGADASIDLPGRNTTVDIAYTHSWDQVCDKDNGSADPLQAIALTGADPCKKKDLVEGEDTAGETVWKDLEIDTAQVTITQNLTPTVNLQLATYGQVLDGFQSNPYRRVRVGEQAPQEHIPDVRARWSVSARVNKFFPNLHGAFQIGGRFYDDTWGVVGGDAELAYSQYLGDSLVLRLHARIYQQTAATFFKDAFFYETQSTAGEFFTGERELSPVRDAVVGAKLTLISLKGDKPVWHLFDKLQFNIKADVLILDNLPTEDPATNPMGISSQFLYGGTLLDAVILQLGLLGNY
nr:DUF3570 domain-containing protein [Kofleriaceae bacterium]